VVSQADSFAYRSGVPESLLKSDDPYRAYLWHNVLPGSEACGARPVPVLLSIEGVVANLFYRWAHDPVLRDNYLDDHFYAQFGAVRKNVSPLENIYLKIFYVLYTHKPLHTVALIRDYGATFPEDAEALEKTVRATLLGQDLTEHPEIWLANPDFKTGTSLFDQFRGLRRTHTFDLNAATLVDLMTVPGMKLHEAEKILRNGPYQALVDGVRP